MVRGTKHSVWVLAAWAVLAAQAAPPVFCRSCDLPCCAVSARDSDTAAAELGGEPDGGCPLCATKATLGDLGDRCLVEQSDQPCHCQLDARQDQPISPPKGSSPPVDPAAYAALPMAAVRELPQARGVSREYLAASLTVPIRPTRILFGVWRN